MKSPLRLATLIFITGIFTSPLFAQVTGSINDDGFIVVTGTGQVAAGLDFNSPAGNLVPIPDGAAAPFTFLLANTANQVTYGNLGGGVTLDGDLVTQLGYTGDPAGDLTAAWGDGGNQVFFDVVGPDTGASGYSLTVLHNNDGESALLPGGAVGGIARFATLANDARMHYEGAGHGVVSVYAGDSFLPSPDFQASLESGEPGNRTFFDALALSQVGYDAAVIGNHEFDAGPSVLAEFIQDAQTTNALPFLSANLDFSGEAGLNAQVGTNLFKSTTVTVSTAAGDKTVGIIGATTENLPFLSSTGAVTVSNVADAVNAEIDGLAGSVDHMILVSHLQGIGEDIALLPSLNAGLDLVVAGGGDEILADLAAPANAGGPASVATTGLLGDDTPTQTAYPNVTGMDSAGNVVPVVTGAGDYKYLGRVTMNFDASGSLVDIDAASNPLANGTDITPNATVLSEVEGPVAEFVSGLSSVVLATSSEKLVGNGDRDVIRANEAGLGSFVADAYFAAAVERAESFGVATPDFAVVNGGGIRTDIEVGDITLATTFDISPFGNIVSVIENMTREDVVIFFENALSRTTDGDGPGVDPVRAPVDGTGRYPHVSDGVEIVYDIAGTPLEIAEGEVSVAGDRILSLIINGEVVVEDGELVPGDGFTFALPDFSANGGDQYNGSHLSQTYDFTRIGVSDQNSLVEYLADLSGGDVTFDLVSDVRYDNVPDGRVTAIPEPSTGLLALLGVLAAGLLRRRR